MKEKELLAAVDHTLLRPTATWSEIQTLCEEAMRYQTASVCVAPAYVKKIKAFTGGRLTVCTVVGFPNGDTTTAVKCFEAAEAIQNGADEIDMVVNLGWVKDGLFPQVLEEICALKHVCQTRILKVIVEACQLTQAEKVKLCELVTEAGADFIKTSTGFSTGGATKEDVSLFRAHIGKNVKIKAAGGISTLADAEDFLRLGASRLGTSRVIRLIREREERET